MRFDDRFLDEIKARLRPSDVIGRSVKLRRQGREFVGLSPFTKEKTPSFYVNDDKGQFFDFSSGKTGDLITFLQETERLSFVEAVERLAAEAGLALPEPDPDSARQEKQRQSLTDWLEAAALWFEAELRRPAGAEARAYLEGRGLPEAEWKRFRLGFAPAGRTALKDYLVAKGARPAELVDAGLLIAPEDGGAPYDRFRGRIIFPIADGRGRVVSFGGRAMDPQARAKYLNGPETAVFHKGRTLYGLAEARKIIAAAPADADLPLVVVEGYMDAIACHRAGLPAAAPLGTALTEEQMELLWRLHPEPTLCFDDDRAGRGAAGRAIERALPLLRPGRSLRFAVVEGGKDPDDVLREQGPAALKAQVARTVPFVEALFEQQKAGAEPLDTPERRTALKVALRKAAAAIGDADLAAAYREELLGRYERLWPVSQPVYTVGGAGRELARQRWRGRGGRGGAPLAPALPETRAAARDGRQAVRPLPAALAVAALHDPSLIDDSVETVGVRGLGDERLDALARELVALRYEVDSLEFDQVLRRLRARGVDEALLDRLDRDARFAGVAAPFLDPAVAREQARRLWKDAYDLVMRLEALERATETAVRDFGRDGDLATLSALKTERDALRRMINGDWAAELSATH